MADKLVRQNFAARLALSPFGPWRQGVNEKAEPHLLDFSALTNAENIIVDDISGRVIKRPGTLFRKATTGLINPPLRGYNFIKRDGTETLILTDNLRIVVTTDLETYTDITPTAFLTDSKFAGESFFIDFATAEDRLWVTNGVDPVFSWTGAGDMVAYDKATTEITFDGADTQTTIIDALLDRAADGTTWVGQKMTCIDATNVNNIGLVRTVSGFDDPTDKITFAAYPETITIGDKFLVGVLIPKGRYIKFNNDTMFVASTPENPNEVRFTSIIDPNEPEVLMNTDNPNAWTPVNQIEVGSSGDRIWGFTNPVYRNRIGIFKSTGIYRIDPDATFKFVVNTITEQFGSRFPLTCQQHGDLLMFLGQDRDGKPDVLMTDFVTVTHFDRKHSKTLDNLQQSVSILKSTLINTKAAFDAGSKSTFVDTASGTLKVGKSDTQNEWLNALVSGSNIDLESTPGKIVLLGQPIWTEEYPADIIPTSATPVWTAVSTSNISEFISGGALFVNRTSTISSYERKRQGVLNSANDAFLTIKGAATSHDRATLMFGLWNGSKGVYVEVVLRTASTDFIEVNGSVIENVEGNDNQHTYNLLLKADGNYKLWKDGTLIDSGTAGNTVLNKVMFGAGQQTADPFTNDSAFAVGANINIDFLHFHSNFKGDSFSTQGGKLTPADGQLPDTLPTSGDIVILSDYKKNIHDNPTLYKFGKYYTTVDLNGGTVTYESKSSQDNADWSDPWEDFLSGEEPGVVGSAPTPIAQYLRIKSTLTAGILGTSPELQELMGGILHLTAPINLGPNVANLGIFQLTHTHPGGTDAFKIRRATAQSLVADGVSVPDSVGELGWDDGDASGNATDAEGWLTVVNGNDLSAVFGGTDSDIRYVQVKSQFDNAAIADNHFTSAIGINWLEGSAVILPTSSVIFNKKWLMAAADVGVVNNNIIVTVDSNRAFNNWRGFKPNFLVWFKSKLYTGNAVNQDLLELNESILSDDDGPSGDSRALKAIVSYIETGQEIGGAIHSRKDARYMEVLSDAQNSDTLAYYKRDTQTSFTLLNTVLFTPTLNHKRLHFPMGTQFKRMNFRLENATLNQDLGLQGIIFGFRQTPSISGL